MHKGDTIPGLITAVFGYSVAIYVLLEDTMRWNAQSSDGVPGAGFFPVLLGFAVGILGLAVVHEAIHGLVWGLCAERRFRAIEFGVIWEMVTPYCTCSDPLRRWQYVLGAAMPTVVLGFIPAVVAAFAHNPLLFALAIVMVLGGGGDALIIIKMLRHRTPAGSSTVYYDHPCECGLVAFTRTQG